MTENTSPTGKQAGATDEATAINGHRSRADALLAAMPADFGKATARRRADEDLADRRLINPEGLQRIAGDAIVVLDLEGLGRRRECADDRGCRNCGSYR